jgi:cytochrome c peroxidase
MRHDLHFGHSHRLFAVVALALVLPLGCSRAERTADGGATPGVAAASSGTAALARDAAGVPPVGAATTLLRGLAQKGRVAAERLAADCDDRSAYLDLRRAALASLSAWRRSNGMAAEATFGPEVALQEAGGSLGALDRAMTSRDCRAAGEAVWNIGSAFHMADDVLGRREIHPAVFAQALSDAAYRLGEATLEATAYVPEGDDAALADVHGLLDFLERGIRAADLDVGSLLAPLLRLRQARTLSEVTGRAALVQATGVLGASIRSAALTRGVVIWRMIRPLVDTPEVSALTLPRPAATSDAAQASLGKELFFDRRLSRGQVRSCATCHIPERAFTDGRVAPTSLDPTTPLRRNTPSLLYAPLEALLLWDGSVRTADRQAMRVIHTRGEMGLTDQEMTGVVSSVPAYETGFRGAFQEEATPLDIGLALSAYEASAFVPGHAPIDRFARGDATALSPSASAGLDVFAGKGRCARCHVPPVFAGSRPPDFTAPIFAVLGVPSAPGARAVDTDRGRDGAFKVPSVRNVARTAPYFHHGRYPTLEQVVDFYDRGGGRGLGLEVPNQDPEIRALHLSAEEKRVLLVFMREGLEDAK